MKIVAKKKFGQNFLKDESVLHQIIEAMPKNDNVIAEIGPGLGDLTKYLVQLKGVTAFEVDTDLCKILQEKFGTLIATNQLRLRCGDVLEVWQSNLLDEDYDLVANLPYYIATNIILKALADPKCQNILVMIQLEVAQKFCATAGGREFGSLSVLAQSVADVSLVATVPPEAFDPAPKVESAVILFEKNQSRNDADFERFLQNCFLAPRKTLLKNLSTSYDKKRVLDLFSELDLAQTIRPHEVCTQSYHQLYENIRSLDEPRGTKKQ
ncbi:MAG: 16S rRNA (adenine(1518)-N(6)/adenine(1519)-N(6))-dimethyltransferase RsmA [Sulfuricurvum sp.]